MSRLYVGIVMLSLFVGFVLYCAVSKLTLTPWWLNFVVVVLVIAWGIVGSVLVYLHFGRGSTKRED